MAIDSHSQARLPLVLASQSPRRVELMTEAGFEFQIVVPDVEEAHDASLTPEALTVENARRKAVAGAQMHPDALVIGADTLVYVDGIPLGKPKDMEEALQMLRQLSGRAHEVCTGVYLAHSGGTQGRGLHGVTHVIFQSLSDDQMRAYHAKVNPLDKAGAYGIQECGEMILSSYDGSWTNVMGLPMELLVGALAEFGVVPVLVSP
jgi:septum formation protein